MNTEVIQEKGANTIKLPSLEDVLNNVRYLVGGFLLAFIILATVGLIKQNMPNMVQTTIVIIFLLICGWILAFTPINKVIQLFKGFKNVKALQLKMIVDFILIGFWFFGWFFGLLYLYIIIAAFFK